MTDTANATPARASGQDLEVLRRRIWVYHQRGLSLDQIAKAVNKGKTTVYHHLKAAKKEAIENCEADPQELMGDLLLGFRELKQEALRNMTQADQGSLMRLNWLDLAARRLKDEADFLMKVGLVEKAADKVDVTVRDVRRMSTEEIERDIEQLRRELAFAKKDFLTTTAPKVLDGESLGPSREPLELPGAVPDSVD